MHYRWTSSSPYRALTGKRANSKVLDLTKPSLFSTKRLTHDYQPYDMGAGGSSSESEPVLTKAKNRKPTISYHNIMNRRCCELFVYKIF